MDSSMAFSFSQTVNDIHYRKIRDKVTAIIAICIVLLRQV